MKDSVDVAVETAEGDYFQFLNVDEEALRLAISKAEADKSALSLVSLDSCAIVIPWKLVHCIYYVPVTAPPDEDSWKKLWELPAPSQAVG